MARNSYIGSILTISLTLSVTCTKGENCTNWNNDDYTIVCEYGCCGSYGEEYCCWDGNVGMIVGIVIGSIASVVTVLVVIFCCCRRTKGLAGHVHQPAATTHVFQMNTVTYAGHANYPVMDNYPPPAQVTAQTWNQPPPYCVKPDSHPTASPY